jgi:replicative DNA helicase
MKDICLIEASLIGALCYDGKRFWPEVAERLKSEFFDVVLLGQAFASAERLSLIGEDIDLIGIATDMADHYEEVDAYLAHGELMVWVNQVPDDIDEAKVRSYAMAISANRARLMIIDAGKSLSNETGDIDDLIAKASKTVSNAATMVDTESTMVDAKEAMRRTLQVIAKASQADGRIGIRSGLTELDEILAGFKPGELIILGARPAMGKTALALTIAKHVAVETKIPVLVFSLEMGAESLGMRVASMCSGISMGKLRVGSVSTSENLRLQDAAEEISGTPLLIDEAASITLPKISARAKRWRQSMGDGPGLIVIDYLTLITDSARKGATKTELVGEISRGLKQLAREIGVPILCLSQLSRELEKRQDKRPIMSDLRDSGSIEQDADVILFLYRDEVYNKQSPDAGTAELIIAKQRSGSVGTVRLTFCPQQTTFTDLSANALGAGPVVREYVSAQVTC